MASVKSLPLGSAEAGPQGGAGSEGGGALLAICPERRAKDLPNPDV